MIFPQTSKLHVPAHGAAATTLLSLPTSLVFKSKIGQGRGGSMGRMAQGGDAWGLQKDPRVEHWETGPGLPIPPGRKLCSVHPLSSLPCLFSAGCHPPSAQGYGSFTLHWNQGRCRCLPALLPPPPTSPDLSKSLDFSKSKFPLYKTQLTKPWSQVTGQRFLVKGGVGRGHRGP